MRIALIHALRHSVEPAEEAFHRLWPTATVQNILDDSLSADLARAGALTPAMTYRFLVLARYAVQSGADGILFTCSAFGPCIDACKAALSPLPVLKPNEAMIDDAIASGSRIGLLATFAPTLASMPDEFVAVRPSIKVVPKLAEGALEAMNAGDVEQHDALAVAAAAELNGCDVIALAQFSLARASPAIGRATRKRVLTTPDSAVNRMRSLLSAQAAHETFSPTNLS
ncbi:aspartate/glutamate racemase family protein [Bradyrhizobium canariense]|uniref:Arylsulfatase n=1 Tax=Bradyrhizobium canariense TaxID=255045 RepID=A0A1H2BIF9_9BRAD|nr:aspartate/glutamate racemase family protein [Bradyrhizobium canariense]SDT57679.1 hypothetical protein SAMN05444158_7185 [Bradyrhizobium canariense]